MVAVGRAISGKCTKGQLRLGVRKYSRLDENPGLCSHALGCRVRDAAAPPISADEVTLRHRIYGDGRVTIFLLDIPPGQAALQHRHDRDMLSVFVNGGRTRASFNGAAPVEDSFTAGDVRFRSGGFTHSTENIGTDRFLSVIFEFADSQGPRESATRPPRTSAIRIARPPASMSGGCSARASSVLTTW